MIFFNANFILIFPPVIRVSFTIPLVRVAEDVGSTQVCLIADTASARQYTVVVGRRPSGDNPATRKYWRYFIVAHVTVYPLAAGGDYTIDNADLTVPIPAGEPMEQCIPVGIVDDEVALEGEETFQFFFDTLEPGVVAGDQSETVVVILDNDGMFGMILNDTCVHNVSN